jgi:tetratricopeptide (TPR) repeat protein
VAAENYYREGNHKNCLKQQKIVAMQFEELNDYETASYFYKKSLDISVESKYVEGEAKAYMGLGICEEKVLNIFEAMGNLETALQKAIDGNIQKLEKEISKELVRVYQIIAIQF